MKDVLQIECNKLALKFYDNSEDDGKRRQMEYVLNQRTLDLAEIKLLKIKLREMKDGVDDLYLQINNITN